MRVRGRVRVGVKVRGRVRVRARVRVRVIGLGFGSSSVRPLSRVSVWTMSCWSCFSLRPRSHSTSAACGDRLPPLR